MFVKLKFHIPGHFTTYRSFLQVERFEFETRFPVIQSLETLENLKKITKFETEKF